MTKDFQFQGAELKDLEKFYKSAPRFYKRAAMNLTNGLAFALRGNYLEELEQSMTIRSPGFVKGSVRVEKAKLSVLRAEVGSIKRERFSGWIEQETGQRTQRKRVQTLTARRSNWRHRVAPRFRLKPGRGRFARPSDFELKDGDIPAFLQILSRKKYRQPYYIPVKYQRLRRGIYIFRAKKIRLLQNLDPDNPQPKRNPAMSRAVKRLDQSAVNREWQKTVKFLLRGASSLKKR
jgi:hypothetical protein